MSCREFEADVVDLAREAQMSVASAARVGEHLEQCAGCAARVARERQLTRALKAVADSTPASSRAAAIEARLLSAFAERHGAASPMVQTGRPAFLTPAARVWLAAAAVAVFAVAAWQGAARWRPADEERPAATRAEAGPAAPAQTTAGSEIGSGAPSLAAKPEIPPRAELRSAAAAREPATGPAAASRAARPRAEPRAWAEVLRFVTLPTAIGLPALESGRIVRVDVPTAMLPAYGLEVAPDSQSGMVEADVLVGQDGQPRAIRFVTLDSESRRRQ